MGDNYFFGFFKEQFFLSCFFEQRTVYFILHFIERTKVDFVINLWI